MQGLRVHPWVNHNPGLTRATIRHEFCDHVYVTRASKAKWLDALCWRFASVLPATNLREFCDRAYATKSRGLSGLDAPRWVNLTLNPHVLGLTHLLCVRADPPGIQRIQLRPAVNHAIVSV